jgi:hypothetical protein
MLGNPRIGVKSVGQEIYGLRRVFVLKFQAGEIAQLYPSARVATEGVANPRAVISVLAIGHGIEGGAGGELPGRLESAAARDISGRNPIGPVPKTLRPTRVAR